MRIDHLGIAVENLSESIAAYESIGLKLSGTEEVPEQKVRVAMFQTGESRIELLETTDPDGPIGRFVAKRGPGIHHVALEVKQLENVLSDLKSRGVRLIDEVPRTGAGGAKIAFIHPSVTGTLIELCEHRKSSDGGESGSGG